ncbi:trimethylamine methyltransferase family protein, partial [Candidatus Bipolaricaulota bacterium]|nr:trimethylamine methyltransferase family protein [Candidatus Bipolaricaulota bacterium]
MGFGLRGGVYRPFGEEEVRRIDEGVMWVLENVGVQVNSEQARDLLLAAGAKKKGDNVILFPEKLVREAMRMAPSKVVLHGREDRHDLTLEDARVYFGTGGTVLYILDLETGARRPTTLQDIAQVGRLVDALENVHFYLLPLYPNELPKENVDVNRFYAGLASTTKHIMGGIYTMEGRREV